MFKFAKKKKIEIEKMNEVNQNLIEGFDEVAYLDANPDVKEGIENGQFRDALHHLETFGLKEIQKGLRKFHYACDYYNKKTYKESLKNSPSEGIGESESIKLGFEYFCEYGYTELVNQAMTLNNNEELEIQTKDDIAKISCQIQNLKSENISLNEEVNTLNISIRDDDRSINERITVSIICRTYNHEKYIRKALNGFLMQKTDFNFEVILGDDMSTDETLKIINEYVEKYPKIFKNILREKNLGPVENLMNLTTYIKGKYVAMCEGDDYWIDPLKLQKQVNFLEISSEYSVCFNKVVCHHIDNRRERNMILPRGIKDTTTFDDLINGNYIHMNSVMYRWAFPDGLHVSNFNSKAMPADWQLHLHHAKKGKIKLLNDVMGVYNKHNNGIWTMSSNPIELHKKYGIGEIEFFKTFEHDFEKKYFNMLQTKQKNLFSLLSNSYIDDENYTDLYKLVLTFKDLFVEYFSERNYNLEKIGLTTEETFKKSIISQNTISVAVTTYNHEKYIKRCLDSIIAQKGGFKLEIIIGDDASTDSTRKIIKEYEKQHPLLIKVLKKEKNIGMHCNLKRTVSACTGKYIAVCEGDDYWISKQKLQKQVTFLRNNQDCKMCFNWLLLYKEEEGTFQPHPEQSNYNISKITTKELAKRPIVGNFSACFYEAKTLKSVPDEYYFNKKGYDWLLNMYVSQYGKIGFIKELLSVYRIHANGLWSGTNKDDIQDKILDSQATFLDIFDDIGLDSIKTNNKNYNSINFINRIEYGLDSYDILIDRLFIQGWMFEKINNSLTRRISKMICFINEETKKVDYIYYMDEVERNDVTKNFIDISVNSNCGFRMSLHLNELDTSKSYIVGLCYIGEKNILNILNINSIIIFQNDMWLVRE